jgi:hypothetical protein
MSYNLSHWCSLWICFFSCPTTTIYVSKLKSPRDLHHIFIKLNNCSFAVKTTHKIHFGTIIIVLVHNIWNFPVWECACGISGVRVLHLPRYVVVSSSIFLTWNLYHIHNIGHDEGKVKIRSRGILVIVGIMINSTKSLVPGRTVLV